MESQGKEGAPFICEFTVWPGRELSWGDHIVTPTRLRATIRRNTIKGIGSHTGLPTGEAIDIRVKGKIQTGKLQESLPLMPVPTD